MAAGIRGHLALAGLGCRARRRCRPAKIDQIGAANKKIALSFDDGPDPKWTPKILDVLKQKNVPGVFFVIGNMANQRPDILKREYAEGHEIGNHTFTHPKFDDI